jgi:COMPASS component SPP1
MREVFRACTQYFGLPQGAEGDDETDLSIYCVTCGQEVNQRGAIKHMEKCFNKVWKEIKKKKEKNGWMDGQTQIEIIVSAFAQEQKKYC